MSCQIIATNRNIVPLGCQQVFGIQQHTVRLHSHFATLFYTDRFLFYFFLLLLFL